MKQPLQTSTAKCLAETSHQNIINMVRSTLFTGDVACMCCEAAMDGWMATLQLT